jgi:hypothetical protein
MNKLTGATGWLDGRSSIPGRGKNSFGHHVQTE